MLLKNIDNTEKQTKTVMLCSLSGVVGVVKMGVGVGGGRSGEGGGHTYICKNQEHIHSVIFKDKDSNTSRTC